MKISEINKILLKRGFKVSRLKNDAFNSKLRSIYGTSIVGILIIAI